MIVHVKRLQLATLDKGEVPIWPTLSTMLFHVPGQRDWAGIIIIPYFQRPRHRDMKRRGSHSTSWGPRQGASLRGKTALPAHAMVLPLLLRMAPLQNCPGWGSRPQTLPSAWLPETHLLKMVMKVATATQATGPSTALLLLHPLSFCSWYGLCFAVKEWMPGCWLHWGKG